MLGKSLPSKACLAPIFNVATFGMEQPGLGTKKSFKAQQYYMYHH